MTSEPLSPTPLTLELADPKRLIFESFRIEGITPEECRSIFVDWALSLPEGVDAADAARLLLETHAPKAQAAGEAGHPMVKVLVEGATAARTTPRRKGGRAGRFAEME
ncbi:hypothetical protein [Paracoccus zhejiangensis]|uniref:Uncharacterized protein n=1 Tax=Paracoccus zhejiangensis TaxID=1077935 RepID=A0A2H5F3T6_9RHOB|nr:hypothetical protein CX676_06660 [Paracoccus zhejiangensis]